MFSREKVAVEHVFDLHQDLLQSPACIIRKQGHLPAEDPKKSLKEMKKFKVSTEILDNTSPRAEVWKCKFCSEHFTALEETVGHLKKMHGVTRQDARNMSMIKISWSPSLLIVHLYVFLKQIEILIFQYYFRD